MCSQRGLWRGRAALRFHPAPWRGPGSSAVGAAGGGLAAPQGALSGHAACLVTGRPRPPRATVSTASGCRGPDTHFLDLPLREDLGAPDTASALPAVSLPGRLPAAPCGPPLPALESLPGQAPLAASSDLSARLRRASPGLGAPPRVPCHLLPWGERLLRLALSPSRERACWPRRPPPPWPRRAQPAAWGPCHTLPPWRPELRHLWDLWDLWDSNLPALLCDPLRPPALPASAAPLCGAARLGAAVSPGPCVAWPRRRPWGCWCGPQMDAPRRPARALGLLPLPSRPCWLAQRLVTCSALGGPAPRSSPVLQVPRSSRPLSRCDGTWHFPVLLERAASASGWRDSGVWVRVLSSLPSTRQRQLWPSARPPGPPHPAPAPLRV